MDYESVWVLISFQCHHFIYLPTQFRRHEITMRTVPRWILIHAAYKTLLAEIICNSELLNDFINF